MMSTEWSPRDESSTIIDYGYAPVGGREYLLPLHAEVVMAAGRIKTRNVAAYREYRKFQTDAAISFDTGEAKSKAGEKK